MSTKKNAELKLFFDILEVERAKRRWTYVELAEKAGLNKKYISLLKNGARNPKAETLEKIAAAFGYQLIDFMKMGQQLFENNAETDISGINIDWKARYDDLNDKYTVLLEKYAALLEQEEGGSAVRPKDITRAHDADTTGD